MKELFKKLDLAVLTELLSDTKGFLKRHIGNDKDFKLALGIFTGCSLAQLLLLSQALADIDHKFVTPTGLLFSNYLMVFLVSLAGHWALKTVKVQSEYKKVVRATLFLYGPALILPAVCIIIYYVATKESDTKYFIAAYALLGLGIYWMCRAWNATAYALGGTKRQSIKSFILANIYMTPFLWGLHAISEVLGKTQ